jgi:polysaccharide pyruvyl transferase WcaK-like protein
VQVPNEYFSPQQMMSFIACCDLTISMRYHFCLFSALQRVPFIALQRSDKVADLCVDLDWAFGARLGELTLDALLEWSTQIEKDQFIRSRLGNYATTLAQRAAANQVALAALQSQPQAAVPITEFTT